MTFGYSRPFASWTEKISGVLKCARAAALSSSRRTITAERTDARDDASSAFSAFSSALSNRTSPAAEDAHLTRKLLSRSTEPKRACLIFNRRLATPVTARVLRKFACSTEMSRAAAASAVSSRGACRNRARTEAQEKKFGCTIWCASPQRRKRSFVFRAIENQRKLGIGEVLHFVDDDEIVERFRLGAPAVGDEIQIEQLGVLQPSDVLFEKLVHRRPRFAGGEEGLPHAQRLIIGARQRPGRRRAEDAAEFFEQGMRVRLAQFAFEAAAPAFEPGAKRREADFDALGNGDRIDEFTETHEFDVLRRILVAVCAVESARRLREIGRERHVEHRTGRLAHLGERHGGLARPCRADDHKGNLVAAHRLLRVVEDDRFVEEFEFGGLRRATIEAPARRAAAGSGSRRHIIGTVFDLRPDRSRRRAESAIFRRRDWGSLPETGRPFRPDAA